jgi:hypothetical protein
MHLERLYQNQETRGTSLDVTFSKTGLLFHPCQLAVIDESPQVEKSHFLSPYLVFTFVVF